MKHYQLRPFSDNLTRRRIITKLAAGGAAMASAVRSHAASPLAAQAATAPLKITSVRAYPVRLWTKTEQGKRPDFTSDFDPRRRRYFGPFAQLVGAIVVVIHTDQGITGYGLGGGGRVAAEIIHGHLRHLLLGTDPRNVELLWDQMYTSGQFYGRRGVFVMALSGIDNALWDIVGKHAGKPVHALIGGLAKKRVPAYFTSSDPEAGLRLGFRHFKIPVREGVDEGPAGMKRTVEMLTRARDRIAPTIPDDRLPRALGDRRLRHRNGPAPRTGSPPVDRGSRYCRTMLWATPNWSGRSTVPVSLLGNMSTRGSVSPTCYVTKRSNPAARHHLVGRVDVAAKDCDDGRRALLADHSAPRGQPLRVEPGLRDSSLPAGGKFRHGDNGTELMEAMSGRYRDGYYYPSEKPGSVPR